MGSSQFFHYRTAGNYLGSITIASRVASFSSEEVDLAGSRNAVPEPSALALAGLGLMALNLTRRRAKAA